MVWNFWSIQIAWIAQCVFFCIFLPDKALCELMCTQNIKYLAQKYAIWDTTFTNFHSQVNKNLYRWAIKRPLIWEVLLIYKKYILQLFVVQSSNRSQRRRKTEKFFVNKQKHHHQQPFASLKSWCESPVFHMTVNCRVNISRTAKCNMATCLHPTWAWRWIFFWCAGRECKHLFNAVLSFWKCEVIEALSCDWSNTQHAAQNEPNIGYNRLMGRVAGEGHRRHKSVNIIRKSRSK